MFHEEGFPQEISADRWRCRDRRAVGGLRAEGRTPHAHAASTIADAHSYRTPPITNPHTPPATDRRAHPITD